MSETEVDNSRTITIFGLEDRGDRSFLRRGEARLGRADVPAEELSNRVGSFLESMRQVIAHLPIGYGDFVMETVAVTAEVTAKGQVSLLGTGVELSGKGGITFTFHRPPVPAAAAPAIEEDESAVASAGGDGDGNADD